MKGRCRLDIKKCSFLQRTIKEWNRLSADCVNDSSVNMLKNKIDKYIRVYQAGCTKMKEPRPVMTVDIYAWSTGVTTCDDGGHIGVVHGSHDM